MSEVNNQCDKCEKRKRPGDAWYRNLHPGFALVCYDCHRALMESFYREKGIRSEAKVDQRGE